MQSFKIGERQLTAFRKDAEERFVASVAAFLKKNIPEAAEDKPEALTAFVSAMLKKAKAYGLMTRHDAAVYVTTSYLLGENFEEHFQVAQTVFGSSLPPPSKVEWLQQATVALLNSGEGKQD